MPQTVDIEITSRTTARATLPIANVPPVELKDNENRGIGAVVHEFLHGIAQESEETVDVVYRTEKAERHLSVAPDGKTEERTPSTPIPVVERATPAAPTVVAAEEISHRNALERPEYRQTPSVRRSVPQADEQATGPITGPLNGLSQLSAPSADAASDSPAERGTRGRLNSVLGLKLAPKPDSAEMRQRKAATAITAVVPEFSVITVANPKGGVGKTPFTLALVAAIARYRGAGSIACADLAETRGSLTDRAGIPPRDGQHVLDFLAAVKKESGGVRPSILARYLVRQPDGSDIIAGVPEGVGSLSFEDAQDLGQVLAQHRELLIADTGNTTIAGSWQWAVQAASALIVPVPLRRDAATAAHRMLFDLPTTKGPSALARTIVVITDGPGDAPMVESEVVEAFKEIGIERIVRMPFEPLFASGERIVWSKLRRETLAALDVLAAMTIGLIAGRPTH